MNSIYLPIIGAILSALITATVTALLFVIRQKNEQIQIIQNKISDKKYEVYTEVLAILFDSLNIQREKRNPKELDLINRLINVKKGLLIYASDDVLNKFYEWNIEVQNGKGLLHMISFLELIVLIRRDMGNPKTDLTSDRILRSLLKSDKDYMEFKSTMHLSKEEYNELEKMIAKTE